MDQQAAIRALLVGLAAAAGGCHDGTPPLHEGGPIERVEQGLAPATHGATLVQHDVPATMVAEATYLVTIEFENTGASSPIDDWTSASYMLRSTSTPASLFAVVNSPPVPDTPVGQTAALTMRLRAPATPGPVVFSARMFMAGGGNFGDAIVVPINVVGGPRPFDCGFVSTSLPATAPPDALLSVDVVVQNTGTSPWTSNMCLYVKEQPYRLWRDRPCVPLGVDVMPGATHSFALALRTPTTPGTYALQRQMFEPQGVGFASLFDLCVDQTVDVVDGAQTEWDAELVSSNAPASMNVGATFALRVQMRNTGTETWPSNIYLRSANALANRWRVVAVQQQSPTAPGAVATFDFTIEAPSTSDSYDLTYRMFKHEQGGGFFGETFSQLVAVGQCGNGLVDLGEDCDDGNNDSGDGCSSTCRREVVTCGNGVVEAWGFEECDDGNLISGDGCSAVCTIEGTTCGNGMIEAGEQCDDGNNIAGDGCVGCRLEGPCGDGVINAGEQCDDGNTNPGDSCSPICTLEGGVTLTFEGLGNVEAIGDYYAGGLGGDGSGPGPNHGITFGASALSIIDSDDGGTGNFGNEPSPSTVLFWLSGSGVTMNVADGFTDGLSVWYASPFESGVIRVYDGLNATGNLLEEVFLPITTTDGGDPNGAYSPFFRVGVTFPGIARSVDFGGTENRIGFDDITLGRPLFELSGTVQYERVPDKANLLLLPYLDHDDKSVLPARRVVVQAIAQDTPIAQALTNDNGEYVLRVPGSAPVSVRALARSTVANYVPDGIGQEHCSGASWDVSVVDNTMVVNGQRAMYCLESAGTYQTTQAGVDLLAQVSHQTSYTDRAGAPFAILDTIITGTGRVCQAEPAVQIPALQMNWSENNTAVTPANVLAGHIGSKHYSSAEAAIYLTGAEWTDTDEFDEHVIAHEFGHHVQYSLYRNDSIGGQHYIGDKLDPRVAFAEGFGNGFSGMVFNDPQYLDTRRAGSSGGLRMRVSAAPGSKDRGIYSETSAQYFFWSLYEARDANANSGSYDRIHALMRDQLPATEGFTTLTSFAAYYNQEHGESAEELRDLWADDLDTPFDALCAGPCVGVGDTADVFDIDNDIGEHYASVRLLGFGGRGYPTRGSPRGAEFWRSFRTTIDGTNAGTEHDQLLFFSDSSRYSQFNKLGTVRWYRFVATGSETTVWASNLGGATCDQNVLDMLAWRRGAIVAADLGETGPLAGCPAVTLITTPGASYIVTVRGQTSELDSWDINVMSTP